jgi:uncharacterized protein YutE (UPF0331/DUF86 family)
MVDQRVAAARVAAIRDALNRVAQTLPADVEGLATDRTAREVVVLNLFVALQESVALAAHWLADDGLHVPDTYREIFLELADEHRIPPELARRLAAAAGFRTLVAHRYGALDIARVHEIATIGPGDLLQFCELASRAAGNAQAPRP